MEILFDTNILIYHLQGQLNEAGTVLLAKGLSGQGAYSVISRIELLGFERPETQEKQAKRLLAQLNALPLTTEVTERTIQLRRQMKIKIPDAIIAATALEHSLSLVTRNTNDFNKIKGLNVVNPFKINS